MKKFLVSRVSGLTKLALKLQFWLCKPGLDSEGISLNSFFPPCVIHLFISDSKPVARLLQRQQKVPCEFIQNTKCDSYQGAFSAASSVWPESNTQACSN